MAGLTPDAKWYLIELMLEAARIGNEMREPYDTESLRALIDAGIVERFEKERNLREKTESRYIPDDVRIAVFARDKGRCISCARADDLQYDHIVPFSRGGTTTVDNLQLKCGRCNRRKSNKHRGNL